MKQKLIKICLIIAMSNGLTIFAKGQETTMRLAPKTENDFLIGITSGLSMPVGNYIKTDYNDPKSGFGGSGYNLGLSGTWYFHKNWGVASLISYHSYSFKGLQSIADGIHEAYAIDSATVNVLGSNYAINFLVGPCYQLPVNQKLSFDFRLIGGLINAHIAGYENYIEDQAASTFSQKASTANTFGYQLGSACRYRISNQFSVFLNLDYFYSKPNFQIEYENRNNNAGRYLTSYNEPITGFNTNLTIAYGFSKK